MMGAHETIDMSVVRPRSGGRDISKDNVKQLMASMREMGLLQPITVIKARVVRGASLVDGYEVIAGRHRYCAAVELNWREIPAHVLSADTDIKNIELIEIDENLCRSELTPAQRASHIKRRKEIWEALHPAEQVAQLEPPVEVKKHGRPQEKGFASETAEVSGESKASVNRHVARAEALGDDINEVVGTSLDKGVELDALAKKPEPERKELIERAKAGEKVSARDSAPKPTNGEGDALVSWLECTARLAEKLGGTEAALRWAKTVHLTKTARAGLAFYVALNGEVA